MIATWHKTGVALAALAIFGLAGCGSTSNVRTNDVSSLKAEIESQDNKIKDLQSEVETKDKSLESAQRQLADAETQRSSSPESKLDRSPLLASGASLLPSGASTGECYARIYIPPTYRTVVDTIIKSDASERVEVTPATFEWVEERRLVKEESRRFEEVQARHEWKEESVMVREAHVEWKKGRGLVERLDGGTGEIMCLVETPAEYEIVRKKVQVEPAGVREIVIPAEYETVRVRKMVTAPQDRRIVIPAEYQFVTRTVRDSEGHMEWRRVLCETNMTSRTVRNIQTALRDAGHNPGPIDGIIGHSTRSAIKSYQTANQLASGGLTHETIDHLEVSL